MSEQTKNCQCNWCQVEGPAIDKMLAALTGENKEFAEKLVERYMYASEGEAYWKCRYLGTWPGDEWLAKEHERRSKLTRQQLEAEKQ